VDSKGTIPARKWLIRKSNIKNGKKNNQKRRENPTFYQEGRQKGTPIHGDSKVYLQYKLSRLGI